MPVSVDICKGPFGLVREHVSVINITDFPEGRSQTFNLHTSSIPSETILPPQIKIVLTGIKPDQAERRRSRSTIAFFVGSLLSKT